MGKVMPMGNWGYIRTEQFDKSKMGSLLLQAYVLLYFACMGSRAAESESLKAAFRMLYEYPTLGLIGAQAGSLN